jgi:hypothetical protein
MAIFENVLAGLLFLMPPGKTTHSQIVVPQETPAPCSAPSLLCRAPRYCKHHEAWTIAEDWETGTARYATIARAMIGVVRERRAWLFPPGRLLPFLQTIIFHESGLRRDIHSGVGYLSRGDCQWRVVNGRKVKVEGSCRSSCLVQAIHETGVQLAGFTGDELVGVSYERTKRCLTVGARAAELAAVACRRWDEARQRHPDSPLVRNAGAFESCVFARYGGNYAPDHPLIELRKRTYDRLQDAPLSLDARVVELLGLDELGGTE